MSKVYRRTENGVTTYLSLAEGEAEIDRLRKAYAQGEIRELFAGSRGATYTDGNGLRIHLHLENAPEPEPTIGAQAADEHRIVTVKGKRYIVGELVPARPRTPGAKSWIPEAYVSYWSERNGKTFGATRFASASGKPNTVGALIWAQVNDGQEAAPARQ